MDHQCCFPSYYGIQSASIKSSYSGKPSKLRSIELPSYHLCRLPACFGNLVNHLAFANARYLGVDALCRATSLLSTRFAHAPLQRLLPSGITGKSVERHSCMLRGNLQQWRHSLYWNS
ncbi:hypothetical protein TNIN_34551 [Trichonephila inaurata madagascariensis]|uniref:Uncharacterized protein n=1 Tax=Trichonephila inaurata madagascariensis TaxID=2747483 RepID=A0A8X7CTE0_9ARAC|nr:hypothetical protein TNIN_34551 [Trichonephila inaurata madagascariensis]